MPRIEVTRNVSADPASVALLLSGPAAVELFADETALAGAGVEVEITPPQRSGIGFAAAISVSSGARDVGRGLISVEPSTTEGTAISVSLRPDPEINVPGLRLWLASGLNDLAALASARSSAA